MKKKLLVLAMAAVMLTLAFTACGSSEKLLFGKELLKLDAQMDIFSELSKEGADIGVMDSIMARYYTTASTSSYKDSMMVLEGIDLATEEYGIAAKKGNGALMSKINEALIALSAEETEGFRSVSDIATDFGLEHDILVTPATADTYSGATDGSWDALVASGKVIVGYTVFAPIAYENEDKVLTGFDIELMYEVFSYLNFKYDVNIVVEPTVIVWANMLNLLNNNTIDLVWNGMTITETRKANMEVGIPYLANKQACVVRKGDYDKYFAATKEAFYEKAAKAVVAVESGSAGHECMDLNLLK